MRKVYIFGLQKKNKNKDEFRDSVIAPSIDIALQEINIKYLNIIINKIEVRNFTHPWETIKI